jgi:hypothetical protein
MVPETSVICKQLTAKTLAVEVEVDFATYGQLASSSWCRTPLWGQYQILNILQSDKFLFLHVGRPL